MARWHKPLRTGRLGIGQCGIKLGGIKLGGIGRRVRSSGVALALLGLLGGGQLAGVHPAQAGPTLLFEADTGRVLYAEDADDIWHPASVTKVMTAYLVFEALKAGKITLETKITQTELSHSMPPSKIGLPIGGELTVEVGIKALIIKSANDVAYMLGDAVAGSPEAFVKLMNDKARQLGMTRTSYANPNGLPAPEQLTTARDLAKLARAVLRDFPEHAALWSMADMRIGKIKLRSHNRLLKTYEGADGLKTGFTCDSGYNVVATATRDGRKLVAVVLGEPSGKVRNLRSSNLLEHGFQFLPWGRVLSSQTIDSLPVSSEANAKVTSVRESVAGFECGRKRPKAARGKGKKVKTVSQRKGEAKAAAAEPKPAAKAN